MWNTTEELNRALIFETYKNIRRFGITHWDFELNRCRLAWHVDNGHNTIELVNHLNKRFPSEQIAFFGVWKHNFIEEAVYLNFVECHFCGAAGSKHAWPRGQCILESTRYIPEERRADPAWARRI